MISGEIGAAYAAGYLSASEAIVCAYIRGKTVADFNASSGAMLAVGASPDKVAEYLENYPSKCITIAAINSPDSVTLSGDKHIVTTVQAQLNQDGVFNRMLQTGGNAYHSSHMLALGPLYQAGMDAALSKLSPGQVKRKPRRPFYSSVFGKIFTGDALGSEYWRKNLEQPVLFAPALIAMAHGFGDIVHSLLEVGPHAALKSPIQQTRRSLGKFGDSLQYIPGLFRGDNASTNLLTVAGQLYLQGASVDVDKINKAVSGKEAPALLTDLPNYSWNHDKIYEATSRAFDEWRFREYPRHDILGSRTPGGAKHGAVVEWRNRMSRKELKWLEDHRVSVQLVDEIFLLYMLIISIALN